MARASRESVAYREYDEYARPEARKDADGLSVVPQKKRRRRTAVRPGLIACLCIFALAAAYIVNCEMKLTSLTAEVSEQTERLDVLTSESVSLTTKRTHSMNMDEIEQYAAGTLGMVKMDSSQIEYVELTEPESITVTKEATSLDVLLGGLVRSFSAIVEYIR